MSACPLVLVSVRRVVLVSACRVVVPLRHSRRVLLRDRSRAVRNGLGEWCVLRVRKGCEVSKESRVVQGVRPTGAGMKTDPSHG